MPLILTPEIDKSKRVTPGIKLYRGFSNRNEDLGILFPPNPLLVDFDSPYEIVDLIFNQQGAQKHILELEKNGHFVSFSLRKSVACYYATSDDTGNYKKPGYIAAVKFPGNCKAVTIDSRGPYMYKCPDGSIWVDLRTLLSLDTKNIGAHSRTIVDHELLLMQGTIRPANIISVRPEDCDRSFLPWKDCGERIKIRS